MTDTDRIESVGSAPLCHGCGLMSHLVSEDNPICWDCFNRHNQAVGGGPLRVVTSGGSYHETPLCPAVRNANGWWYWRDEECCYADLGGDLARCRRCYSFRTFGFDHHRGDTEVLIGHV